MNEQLKRETFFGGCPHDCPDTCAMVYEVADGKLVDVKGNKEHPMTRGTLCVKLKDYHDHHYNPDRVLYPLRRTGPKGSKQYERITWDEALGLIKARWTKIIAKYGAQAIMPYSYLGNEGLIQGMTSGDRVLQSAGLDGEREDVLRLGVLHRVALDGRPHGRRRSGKLHAFQVHRHLGLQHHLDQPAPLAVRAGSAEERRQGRRHRRLPLAHGQGRRLAHHAAPRHRRRTRHGLHQRADRPRPRRSGLGRQAHARLPRAERARGGIHARVRREDHGRAGSRHHQVRARVRDHSALRDPARRGDRAACRRRADHARGVRDPGVDRLLAPRRRRLAADAACGSSPSTGRAWRAPTSSSRARAS